jgi:hypothetical protein
MRLPRLASILLALGILGTAAMPALGASHREAPNTAKDPSVDNTDVYAFVSPDKPDTVTLIANYIPFQEPNGGPNFYPFDDAVRYEIYVDNNGDGTEDVSYYFQFETTIANEESFLYNTNTITPDGFENLNVRQTYTLTEVRGGTETELGSGLPVPPANVGPRSTPDYDALAAEAIREVGDGVMTFAGQRDDPFFVDVGAIFDLGGLRPFNEFHLAPLPAAAGIDSVGAFNVNTLALQVPIEQLTNDGEAVAAADADNAVIGVWAAASRQAESVLSVEGDATLSGDFVQVSRMGNPLINEVIIPLGEKDAWNRSRPADDSQFMDRYLQPELAALVNLLYPALPDTRESDRTDLVLLLLQGVPGLNSTGEGTFDMLRLNMGIPPSANPSRLGVVDGDLAGFPNGRRLWDDVTDIELRAVADGYGTFLNENFDLPNETPNNTLGDGCDANDKAFLSTFPYVAAPHQGYAHNAHHNTCSPMPDSATETPTGVPGKIGPS